MESQQAGISFSYFANYVSLVEKHAQKQDVDDCNT